MATHPGALRHWYIPLAATALAMIALLLLLGIIGVLPSQPLQETQVVLSLKWGLIIAFILQMVFVWRDHRKYTVTVDSLASIPEPGSPRLPEHLRTLDREHLIDAVVLARVRARGAFMLGNVTGAMAMLAGLYVITRSVWFLSAMALYVAFSVWIFRPLDPRAA